MTPSIKWKWWANDRGRGYSYQCMKYIKDLTFNLLNTYSWIFGLSEICFNSKDWEMQCEWELNVLFSLSPKCHTQTAHYQIIENIKETGKWRIKNRIFDDSEKSLQIVLGLNFIVVKSNFAINNNKNAAFWLFICWISIYYGKTTQHVEESAVYICLHTFTMLQRLLIAKPISLLSFFLNIEHWFFFKRWQYVQATYSTIYFPCD